MDSGNTQRPARNRNENRGCLRLRITFKLKCGHTTERFGDRLILKHLGYLYCFECKEKVEVID
jgi:hypothetical protein